MPNALPSETTPIERLIEDLVAAAMAPQGDETLLRSDVRRVLTDHKVVLPGPDDLLVTVPFGWVWAVAEPGKTVTVTEPGYRAVIVPDIGDPEVNAMAACLVLLEALRIDRGPRAVRRAIGWLSERLSADEMADTLPKPDDEPF